MKLKNYNVFLIARSYQVLVVDIKSFILRTSVTLETRLTFPILVILLMILIFAILAFCLGINPLGPWDNKFLQDISPIYLFSRVVQ